MKKLLTLLFIFSLSYGISQSLSLSYKDSVLKFNDTIVVNLSPDEEFVKIEIDITNNSEDDYNVKVKGERISGTSSLTFCFNKLCYSTLPVTSPDFYYLSSGQTLSYETDPERYFYIQYGNVPGASEAKFIFFNEDDVTNGVVLRLMIDNYVLRLTIEPIPVGIKQPVTPALSLKAYPNPASEKVTIEYSLPNQSVSSSLVLKNIMGVTVLEESLSHKTDKIALDLSNIPRGIYFYSIENSGKAILTKKLIVK